MKKKTLLSIVLGLVLLSAAAPPAGSDIYVGGPWGTRIASLPYTITAPGAYYLGGNLTYSGTSDGITVMPGINHVTLDLMGFTLNGSGSGHCGIYLNGSKNVEVRNGTVTGWFLGIFEESGGSKLHRILNVRVVGNSSGISLNGMAHLVQGCEVTVTGSFTAIFGGNQSTVSGCKVQFVDGYGIYIFQGIDSHNVVLGSGAGSPRYGIYANGRGTLIKGNQVSGCATGILSSNQGQNIIGNTVDAASGTTGITMGDYSSNLEDQNTVTGSGTHYDANYTNVKRRSYY